MQDPCFYMIRGKTKATEVVTTVHSPVIFYSQLSSGDLQTIIRSITME